MIAKELVRVGDTFKVNAVNAKGWYTVISAPNENNELDVKGDEAHVRTVRVSQLGRRKGTLGIVSDSIEKVGEVWGAEIWTENVIYLPDHKKRGKKPRG